jgi:hypothetical protein
MPVEIKELIIRAVVTTGQENTPSLPQTQMHPDEREAIIQECIQQILRILKKQKER